MLGNRRENTYLLPASTQFECDGSRTASNRSLQWGARVVAPIFESKTDYELMYRLAGALDAAAERRNMPIRIREEMFKPFEIRDNAPTAESILRFSREHLAPYKRIRRLEFADLPKTISGKIRRVELRGRENAKGEARGEREFREEDFPSLKAAAEKK